MSAPYNSPEWYSTRQADPNPSAREIVPVVMELVHSRSVVDVGCGTAGWLAVFRALGIENTIGVDGDYMDRSQLEILVDRFIPDDLTKPLALSSRFDPAICLGRPAGRPGKVKGLPRLCGR